MQKAVFLDIDGTIKRRNLTELLLLSLIRSGMLPEDKWKGLLNIRELYKRREITWFIYDQALISAFEQETCLKGLPTKDVRRIARNAVDARGGRVNIFTRELIHAAKECEYVPVFVSGSPVEMVQPFAERYGCQIYHGTVFEEEAGAYMGGSNNWRESKDITVRRLAEQHNLDLGQSVAVGDTVRDISMFGVVEFPILFNPDAELFRKNRENDWPWPIIVEQRIIYALNFSHIATYGSVDLADVLPEDLATNLVKRLRKLGLLA